MTMHSVLDPSHKNLFHLRVKIGKELTLNPLAALDT